MKPKTELTRDQKSSLKKELREKSIRINELNRLKFDPTETIQNQLKAGLQNRIIEINQILEGKIDYVAK